MKIIIGQLIGFVATVLCFLIYQQKDRKRILFVKLLADLTWMLHYFLLSAYSGVAICIISTIRAIVFLNPEKKWADKRFWVPLFLLMAGVMGYLTWNGIFSLFPILASVISIISFAQNKPKITRLLAFPVSASLLTYDFYIHSIPGIVNESAVIISSFIGLLRYDKKSK